jgi:hypothetical protein
VCHLGRGHHGLELWKIKGTVWEECPIVGSHFALGICFFIAPYNSGERK